VRLDAVRLAAAAGTNDVIQVLLVEDDDDYSETLADQLSLEGFAVQRFADAAALFEQLGAAADADVIVLDWMLPKTSGIDLLPRLRRYGVTVPIVFLTARPLAKYERLAFERGAIDFIDKVRGVEVLARRLRRAVAATKPAPIPKPESRVTCGRLALRPDVGRAYWDEVDIGLTLGEYKIVNFLVSNIGRDVTYREVYDLMYFEGFVAGSGDDGYRSNVRSAMKRIRNKFRERDPTFAEIENCFAVGYHWRAPEADGEKPAVAAAT
jgi:two-component system response regulator ChvI